MAYQFLHVNTYSIKSGGKGVAAEAGRTDPAYCQHVENPEPPILLAGMEPESAWDHIETMHANSSVKVMIKGVERTRKLRSDVNVLLAAVASYPVASVDLDKNDPTFKRWVKETLEYLTKQHGEPLSAVLHLDESHPHIHFLTAPDLTNGQTMASIHPGEAAKEEKGGRNGKKSDKDSAYKAAMRKYQDDYYVNISAKYGHARLGPRRQRLTRNEWMSQQAQEKALGEVLKQAEAVEKKIIDIAKREKTLTTNHRIVSEERNKLKKIGYRLSLAMDAVFGISGRAADKVKETYAKKLKAAQAALKSLRSENKSLSEHLESEKARNKSFQSEIRDLKSDLQTISGESYENQFRLNQVTDCLLKNDLKSARIAAGIDNPKPSGSGFSDNGYKQRNELSI